MIARSPRPHSAVFVGVLAVLITACASEKGRQQLPFERTLQRTRIALKAAADADSLAAAAEISAWPAGRDARRLTLLTRAAALAPTRADLLWLQLETCAQVRTCDPKPIATSLHALDPGNGAAWALLLNRAARLGDTKAAVKYLTEIGDCTRFDLYWNTSIVHLTKAVIKAHTMDVNAPLTTVIGDEAALAIPAYINIFSACEAPALGEPGRLSTCRDISSVMRSGDTYISEMIGIAIAKRVWSANSTEYADAASRQRVERYRMHTAAGITLAALHTDADATTYLQLLGKHRTEQGAALELITSAGENPNPPSDFDESLPRHF